MKQENTIHQLFQMLDSDSKSRESVESQTLYGTFSSLKQAQAELLVMNDKLIKIARLLPQCIWYSSELLINDCENLAMEVHQQEKQLTKSLLGADIAPHVRTALIRLPYRFTRIADMMENILNRCRIKAEDKVSFTSEAHSELDRLCAILLHMLLDTRVALDAAEICTLEHLIAISEKLHGMLSDFRLAHWGRVETGACHYQASSMYLDVLDSIDLARKYLEKISRTLFEFNVVPSSAKQIRD